MLAAGGVSGSPPPLPEEVGLWIRSQDVSSTRLKMAGHGPSVAAGLAAMDPTAVNSSSSGRHLASLAEGNTDPDLLEARGERRRSLLRIEATFFRIRIRLRGPDP